MSHASILIVYSPFARNNSITGDTIRFSCRTTTAFFSYTSSSKFKSSISFSFLFEGVDDVYCFAQNTFKCSAISELNADLKVSLDNVIFGCRQSFSRQLLVFLVRLTVLSYGQCL